MSHEGPSFAVDESAEADVAARTPLLSPKTSAARFVTSEALTRAVSDRVVVSAVAGREATFQTVSTAVVPTGSPEGSAAGAGEIAGAGACTQATAPATMRIRQVFFKNLPPVRPP